MPATLRRFGGITTRDAATGAPLVVVERLGGSTRVGDASGLDVLPLDLSLGHVETAAAVTRSCIRVFDRAVLVDPWTFVEVLTHAGSVSVKVSMARLRAAFAQRLPDVTVRMQ